MHLTLFCVRCFSLCKVVHLWGLAVALTCGPMAAQTPSAATFRRILAPHIQKFGVFFFSNVWDNICLIHLGVEGLILLQIKCSTSTSKKATLSWGHRAGL